MAVFAAFRPQILFDRPAVFIGVFAGMKTIDEPLLEVDIAYRYDYLTEFIGFGEDDVAAIRGVIAQFAPKIPEIVEATYEKLLSYDATARHFIPRQHGFDGALPESMDDLSQNHEQIQFRKEHLNRYLMQLLGHAYNSKMATYLDMVGKMHTPKAGSDQIDVPLVQMNALMGLLSDVLTKAIIDMGLDGETTFRTIRAFNKLLWIQNDFINRHYQAEDAASAAASSAVA